MERTVLVVGGTGRTGRRVVEQLLGRGVSVRAIVRSAERLPAGVATNPRLTVVEADLLSLSDAELCGHVRGCDAVISCLGHVLSLKGIFGPPRDLVTRATTRLCRAIEAVGPAGAGQVHPHEQCLGESAGVPRHASRDDREGIPCGDSWPAPAGEGQPARCGLPLPQHRSGQPVRSVGRRFVRTRSWMATSRSTRCTRGS